MDSQSLAFNIYKNTAHWVLFSHIITEDTGGYEPGACPRLHRSPSHLVWFQVLVFPPCMLINMLLGSQHFVYILAILSVKKQVLGLKFCFVKFFFLTLCHYHTVLIIIIGLYLSDRFILISWLDFNFIYFMVTCPLRFSVFFDLL